MTPADAYRWVESVLTLSAPQQAVCVRLAAEASAPVWREWCDHRGIQDRSGELLIAFDRWLRGAAADGELDAMAAQHLASLPQDLTAEPEPAGGYAGWALLGVAQIALDQCGDAHDDILHTDVCYSAAAFCRSRAGPLDVCWPRLAPAELAFLEQWWGRCCELFPALASVVHTPNQALQAPPDGGVLGWLRSLVRRCR